MSALTTAERETLNAAMDIILAHTPPNASWSFGANYWNGSCDIGYSTYFTSERVQHSFLKGETFADHVASAIAIQADEDANADQVKANQIARLREQLEALTGEVVS